MSGIASATAWSLVHFLWQGTLVGLVTGGLLSLLERRRASTRYALAAGALLVMAALPVLTALQLAPLQVETLPAAPAAVQQNAGIQPASGNAGIVPAASPPQTFGGSLLPWVLGLWLAGVAALSIYHLGGWRFARRLSGRGRPAGDAVAALARELCRRLGIRRAVTFLESSSISVPMVVGWLRPVVLVPASAFTGLSPAQLEAILAHELAHVRRHDYLVNLLQTAVETLLFYHPAVWWVSAQIRRERENCCDDLAVAVCGDRLGYARALVDLEGLRSTPRLALAASGGSLADRVRRLVGAAPGRPSRRFFAAGLLALALLQAGAAVQLACAHDSAKDTSSAELKAPRDPATRHGRWKATSDGRAVRLEMTYRKAGWGSWTSIDDYPIRELPGFSAGSDVRYELRRDAGTFRFRGGFDGKRGRGTVAFTANPAYAKIMDLPVSSDRLMELAIQDVSFDFTREMKELGLADPAPAKQAGNGSPFAFLRDLVDSRRSDSLADRLVQLRVHRITPEYVRGMRESGYLRLEAWQLVELRIHGIEPEYVKGLAATGYRQLFPYRIVEFHTHGIIPEWLRGIVEAGYANATPDQIISLHVHAIDGDFIRKAQAQGYRGLRPEQLIDLRVQGKVRA
ncbi:MAG TPA: M56 family metallopeptidase [Thermoanaerobaculia bacterium]|jgi:beta-lactamase regulating signal transducer with metallopeptidase domain|nr:M56 family metallopeptidase [Thermoanaerobaculia bacterium]